MTGGRAAEAVAIVDALDARGRDVRILGGVAVLLHTGSGHREPEDIDLVTTRPDVAPLAEVLGERGYEANTRFNAMHGDTRNIFHGPEGKLDVFIGDFSMCHRLDLSGRLDVDRPTIPVADLLLTKLQIVELTAKDIADLRALVAAHELAEGPGDAIDLTRVAEVLCDDWGYWRTATETLERLAAAAPELAPKTEAIRARIDAAPKSRRYKLRARIGERRRWYELPEVVGG